MSYAETPSGPQRPIGKNEAVALRIGRLVDDKSEKYGDSVSSSERIMAIWFPKGIPVERLGDAGLMLRCLDKLARLATAPDAYGESPWADLAGYAIRGQEMWERKKSERERLNESVPPPWPDDHETHVREFAKYATPMDFSYRPSDVHLFSVTEEAPGAPSTCPDVEPVITRNETPKTEWCEFVVVPAPRWYRPPGAPYEQVCVCDTCTGLVGRAYATREVSNG